MGKSFVTLEQRVCIVCGKEYDTDTLLIDKRMSEKFDMHTVTGWGMCNEHTELRQKDFIAMIEIDPEKSGEPDDQSQVKPDNAYRTGNILHLHIDAFRAMFNAEVPPKMICFIDSKITALLKENIGETNADITH